MIKTDTLPQFLRNKVAENYYVAVLQKKFLQPCICLSLS